MPLPEGRHDYKFVVDGEWMLDVNQERSTNESGALNNVCWVPEVSNAVSCAMSQDSHASSKDVHFMTLSTAIDAEDPQEEDSESDTESTASSTDLSTRQPHVKLSVKCFQAPHVLKENLSKQIQLHGLSDNVTRMQWNTSRNGKGYYTVHLTPPQVGEDAILMLNGSLLLGKYKLSVQKQNRTRRQKQSSTKEERPSEKEKLLLSKNRNTKAFVGSIPKFVTENQLKDHFSSFKAKIVRVEIIRDKESRESKGFGFITFSNRISAEAAVKKMAGILLLNKYQIKVNLAKAKEDHLPVAVSPSLPRQETPDNSDTESVCSLSGEKCQLFINSNPPLPDKITNKQISEHFSSYKGRFSSAKVIRDKQRKSKGYAVITFTNADLADEAARVYNDSMLLGVFKLNIHYKQGEKKAAPSVMKSSGRRRSSNSEKATPHEVPASLPTPFTVKLTCLPPSLTKENLLELLRTFGELSEPPKIFESKNRYALANYSTLVAAQKAIHGLDKKVLDGYTINLSLKGGESIKPSVPQPPTPSPALGSQWIVSLDHVDSLVSAEELKTMVGVSGVEVERLTSPHTRVLLYLPSNEDAHNVVKQLNGMSLLGKAIQANVITSGRTLNKEVSIPFDHQHSIPTQAASTPYRIQQIIPPQLHSSMLFPPPSVTVPTSLQSSIITHSPGSECSLTLSPADWNRLMIAGPSGRMLYQDVIEPYKTNPSVHIREDMISRTIFFAGNPEAIASAYSRVTAEVYQELTIQDRHKKTSLVVLRQDLPGILQQKYNVRLTGYDESSSFIRLVGDDKNFRFARQELESALGGIETLEVNISLAQPLLRSARERFCIENRQVCIFSHDTRPSVVLYSLSKYSANTASVVLQQGLFTENITNISSEICDKVISTLNPFVDIEQKGPNVLVRSYMQQEFVSVCTALREKMEAATSQRSPVQCSPEEIAYLIHLHKTDHKAREQLSSLSAEFVVRKSTAFLKGNPQAIQTAQELIRVNFLSQVSTRRFVYQNKRFVSQLEDVVLKPVSDEVISIIQEQKAPHKQRSRSEGDETEISVIICSKHLEVFQNVCSKLEQVKPSNRKLTLRKGAAKSIKLNEIKSELEMSYRVRIINRDDFLMIHGLTKKEVCDCAAEIQDKVDSCHEITKFIPLTNHQQLFIRHKQDLEELKEDCNELRIVKSRNESEMFSILIRGPIKSVEPVYEKLVGIINGLTTSKFEVKYESKYYLMWKKRWDQIRKDKERTGNIVIDISREAKQLSTPKNEVITTTIYVVGEESEVLQIGEEISQTATITKTIPLSPIAASTLIKDKKEFLWPLAVYFYIKCQSTTFEAELTAPEDCSEDLDTAEEEIQKFLGERTITNKILTSSDEVVGLVLNSHSKYATTYLSHANSIARNCRVKVHPLKKPQSGLKLSGTPAAILIAEQPLITQVIRPIELSVGQEQLKVKAVFRSVFSTSNFVQFTYKLQDELCVVCTYPRSTKPNKVVRSSMIQPSSTARCLKLEICKGSVVSEQTDVIVNAANEDLQHIGGLAKAILEAGGQAIQTESDDYVRDNMKLKAGEVVALGPGKLPCKVVVHAVGPRWQGGKVGEESLLYITVYKSLVLASSAQYESISLPAISAGIFAVPTSLCAKASLKAVQDFCQTHPSSTLHTVRFVLFAQSELDDFCSYFDSGAVLASSTSQPSAANPVTPAPSGAWFWTNDLGTYTPYTSDISQQLSTVHSVTPRGSCNLTLHGQSYCVDFPTMIQTNVQTGHRRVVKYDATASPPSSRGTADWFYRDDKSNFSPYNSSDNQSIEQMYRDGVPGVLKIGHTVYTFDFSSMCQINTSTNYKRPLQRREGPNHPKTPVSEICDPSSRQNEVCVTLRGPRDSLEAAKTRLKRKLDTYMQTEIIKVGFALSREFSSKLENIATKHQVGYSVTVTESQVGSKKQSLVTLEGINSDVQGVVKTVQQLIIDHQLDRAEAEEFSTPPEWQDQNLTTEVFPVLPKTHEWTRVEQKFKTTLPTSHIVSISRIQNTWLWEAYCAHKKRLHLKNSGNVNEKELFHGTRGNDPKLIYEGENGFDMRYSNKGMWGTANYFAVNANYSNNYSYTTSDGCKEMFLVKVLTGDSYKCVANSSLRKPPQKPLGSGGGKVHFTKMDYDSVTGDTNGSQVFMTYDNDKAYPAYLIKYRN